MGQVLSIFPEISPPRRLIFGTAIIHRLIDTASRLTGISHQEIMGGGRNREAVWIRWAVSLVAREHGRTLHQIADCLDRDHTTILHGLRQARTIKDADFAELVRLLREAAL